MDRVDADRVHQRHDHGDHQNDRCRPVQEHPKHQEQQVQERQNNQRIGGQFGDLLRQLLRHLGLGQEQTQRSGRGHQ